MNKDKPKQDLMMFLRMGTQYPFFEQRQDAADRITELEQEVERLQRENRVLLAEKQADHEEVERLLMSRARKDAMLAIYMQAIASEARKGRDGWAQGIVHRADEAALRVKRSDLTIATVSAEAQEDGDE